MKEIIIQIFDILTELCGNSKNYNQYLKDKLAELQKMIDELPDEDKQ